jgi:hypothetical protein
MLGSQLFLGYNLGIMPKHWILWVFGVLILAIGFMTVYDQLHYAQTKQYDIKCTQSTDTASVSNSMTCTANNSDQTQPGQYQPRKWHVFVAWPDGITALLLLLTLGAIVWQAVATQISAQATLELAKLQSAGMAQWVDVTCTSTSVRDYYPTTIDGDSLAKSIGVHFSASNKTDYPLTIKEVSVNISRERLGKSAWEPYARMEETILSPKSKKTVPSQANMSDYNFAIFLDLDIGMAAKYRVHEFMFSVSGSIRFKPVVGDPEDQRFGFLVKSGPNFTHHLVGFSELQRGEETEQADM